MPHLNARRDGDPPTPCPAAPALEGKSSLFDLGRGCSGGVCWVFLMQQHTAQAEVQSLMWKPPEDNSVGNHKPNFPFLSLPTLLKPALVSQYHSHSSPRNGHLYIPCACVRSCLCHPFGFIPRAAFHLTAIVFYHFYALYSCSWQGCLALFSAQQGHLQKKTSIITSV